ncbi:MAG TPA: ABC transporter ATP-binding protein [Jiangellales bacterium]|nr:ABC transporter ATP-binding protein [Jiangellales bacterium]
MSPEPVLEISNLDAYYRSAHILHSLSCSIREQATAIIGRNGMGKSTLCKAIMGMAPPRTAGSIRFAGRELLGLPSYAVCRAGIAYVPQGRRVFPSLSTEEHLRMIGGSLSRRGRWTIDAVYDLYPALASRRRVSGAQLSGGEQQMLAIGRALLTNPTLLLMDEPSEGLAPAVVDSLIDTCRSLLAEGVSLLLVEQNLGMAASVCDRLLVMVGGELALETTSAQLLADEDLQRRYLGVEPVTPAGAG